jgi:hypothetical protein
MIKIEEATEGDFEQVHALLMQLNSTTISRETWQKTFENPFNTEGPPGYILKDDETVVGFLGTIFSKRIINNKEVTFCNMHSWIVDEKYRRNGLLLLNRIHKLKDVVLTNFSASTGPFQMLKQLKWKEVDNSHSIFYRHPLKFPLRSDVLVQKGEAMNDGISETIMKIAADHKPFRCAINVLRTVKGSALQVFKPIPYFPARFSMLQRILPYKFRIGQLYYTSNAELFFADFQRNIQAICKKEGWVGVVIPDRMLQKAGIAPGKKYYAIRPVLVKSDIDLDFETVDLLYSEVFVLDLK